MYVCECEHVRARVCTYMMYDYSVNLDECIETHVYACVREHARRLSNACARKCACLHSMGHASILVSGGWESRLGAAALLWQKEPRGDDPEGTSKTLHSQRRHGTLPHGGSILCYAAPCHVVPFCAILFVSAAVVSVAAQSYLN